MKEFHYPKGNVAIRALTVGELIDALARYPREMPVLAEWEGQKAPLGFFMDIAPFFAGVPAERCDCLIIDAESDA